MTNSITDQINYLPNAHWQGKISAIYLIQQPRNLCFLRTDGQRGKLKFRMVTKQLKF